MITWLMCGINGFNWKDEGLIKTMNQKLAHRGPDDEGILLLPKISLGHKRLSIIDLSARAHQPMQDIDKRYSIVYNGELYNFREIREQLKNKYTFISDSDTEVILYSFIEWGKDCLDRFNGIFAFAIWDNYTDELFIARDHVGIKPLYYYFDGKQFIFSSEIKSILEHDIPREIDKNARQLYFRVLYVPAPLTIFKNIKKLQPGHYLLFKKNEINIRRYWKVRDFSEFKNFNEAKDTVRSIFLDSVKRQLISDRPVGVFLSGGIDSTAVLGAVSKFTNEKINTYSIGFDLDTETEKFNADLKLARETAKFYNTEHHEIIITGRKALENFEKVIYHMDEPVANSIQIATMLLAEEAKKKVAVVLGGDGGDEMFGGYPRYYLNYLISKYQKFFHGKTRYKLSVLLEKILRIPRLGDKLEAEPGVNRWASFMLQKEPQVQSVIGGGDSEKNFTYEYFNKIFFEPYTNYLKSDFEKIFMLVDTTNWLTDESLLRSDKMTMAYGLEERVPILDYRLIETAARIPTKWKVKNAKQGKVIWKEAIADFLPENVKIHPKHGFFSPASKWLRGDFYNFAKDIFNSLDEKEYNKKNAIKMFDDHISGKKYNLNLIWAIITFEVWKKKFDLK